MNKINSVDEMHPQIKMIINTLLERCKKERDHGILQVPLENFIQRGSYYTALPATLIDALYESEKGISHVAYNVTIPTIIAISRTLEKSYANGQYPTITGIYTACAEMDEYVKKSLTRDQFASFLYYLGYHYKVTSLPAEKHLLTEKPEITFERTMFLKRMHTLREDGVKILYVGERLIQPAFNIMKMWPHCDNVVKKREYLNHRFILYHVVSCSGLHHYLFTNSIASEDFRKWLEDIVLPSLKFKTAIILEDNPAHPKSCPQQISIYHSKLDMLKYLKTKNVPCSSKMSKAELFNLIQLCEKPNTNNSLENLLQAYGHQLLFLPKNYESLTMVQLLWDYVDRVITKNKNDHIITVKERLEKILVELVSSANWIHFNDTIAQLESTLRLLDNDIENAIEVYFKFKIDDTDSGDIFQSSLPITLNP